MPSRLTSETHPLRIDAVQVPGAEGLIGLTFCPGKHARATTMQDAQWERSLAADLDVIAAWGATHVVSVMEQHEFEKFNVPALGAEIEARGISWHHLPVPDGGIPDETFERHWTYHGHVLRQALLAGERVLIHCRGGLGRTGLLASRLLVEFGEDPRIAIERVRAARPDSVETFGQEAHVEAQLAAVYDTTLMDRLLGTLLGGAVGDGFGYTVEFDQWPTIVDKYGPEGLVAPKYWGDGKLHVSDDTQMTLFTLEGFAEALEAGTDDDAAILEAIRQAYLRWLTTQTRGRARLPDGIHSLDEMHRHEAPGNTCLSALREGGHGTTRSAINDSKGCGGVMRVAPLGLWLQRDPGGAIQLAAEAAAITHGHPSGFWSAGALAGIVRQLADGHELTAAIEQTVAAMSGLPDVGEALAAIGDAVRLAAEPETLSPERLAAELGGGWVGEEALAIGIYAALRGRSFEDAVRIAANHSGDSDSTASITGQLRGAAFGISDVPHAWARRLDVLQACGWVADRALAAMTRPTSSQLTDNFTQCNS
jgi:ADP-ribosyl-[dinitrogen reductase] hydrolase